MSGSYLALKIAGPILAIAFIATLKPLARLVATRFSEPLSAAFNLQVDGLTAQSGVGGGSFFALLIGIGVWIAAAILLDPLFGDFSIWLGAALGFGVLYLYFFLRFYRGAKTHIRNDPPLGS